MDFAKVKKSFPQIENISCDGVGSTFYCMVSVKKDYVPAINDKKKIANLIWEVLYDDGNRIPSHNINVSFTKR